MISNQNIAHNSLLSLPISVSSLVQLVTEVFTLKSLKNYISAQKCEILSPPLAFQPLPLKMCLNVR